MQPPRIAYLPVAVCLALASLVSGCDDNTGDPVATTSSPAGSVATAGTSSSAPAPLEIDKPPVDPAIELRAKNELDGKEPDADFTGTKVTVGKVSFVIPKGWKSNPGPLAADEADKAWFGAKDDGDRDALATALGLSECKWNPTEPISLGKDRIPADVADGLCKRGAASAKVAYAMLTSDKVVALGGWDGAGGDDKPMWNAFRSARRVGGGPGGGLSACCSALQGNAASAPPNQKGAYLAAAATCRAMMANPSVQQALAAIRAQLKGAPLPPVCR